MRRRLYLSILVFWVALTLTLTSVPNPSPHLSLPFWDKLAHFGFYGVAGILCALWRREGGMGSAASVLSAIAFAALLGALDEIHQQWIPGRSMEFLDWVADVTGGTTGAVVSMVAASLFPSLLSREIQSAPRALTG
jgi:VanZ family protein